MEVAGIPLFAFVGFVLTILALIIDLVGFAAPYWFMGEIGGIKFYGGLWKECQSANSVTNCVDLIDRDDVESWYKAVQAMETLGFILLVAALAVVVLKLFIMKDKNFFKWVIIGTLAAGAAFIIIGVCIFGAKAETNITDNLHFAFAFVIIAAIAAAVAAGLFGMVK